MLTLLKMDSVVEKDFIEVHPDMSLKDMVDVISRSHRNLFPVTDEAGVLLGVVLLDDIRNIIFRPDLYRRMHVNRFMSMPPAKVVLGTPMEQVMRVFDDTNAWNLPVVVLACAWSYLFVGDYMESLLESRDEGNFYSQWIATYTDPVYRGHTEVLIDFVDRLTLGYTEEQLQNLERIITNCSYYEHRFWDMAWNQGESEHIK